VQPLKVPTVSVIMPNYNGERFVGESVQSVLNQTFQDWELLVIDDGSKDKSEEIVQSFARKDPRVRPLKTTFQKVSRGPAAARNTGIQQARGRYIAFLDSDDLWLPNKLEVELNFMRENAAPFVFSWYEVISESGQKLGEKKPQASQVTYRQLLKDCIIGCLTAMYDTETLGKQLINMHPLDRFADYSLWLKLLKITPKAYCVPQILAQYRLVGGSISANKLQAAQHNWHLLRHIEGLSLVPALYYFTWYASKGILTKLKYLLFRAKSEGENDVQSATA
jgi:teichuronic acid biosynthesis glycosyltransferase TuaG